MNPQDYMFKLPENNYNYEKNDSIVNDINKYNKLTNEGVNHIVAAFYIKSIQDNKNNIKDIIDENKTTDDIYKDVNEVTNNQLNYVDDFMKKINKKMNEIIEKDYTK